MRATTKADRAKRALAPPAARDAWSAMTPDQRAEARMAEIKAENAARHKDEPHCPCGCTYTVRCGVIRIDEESRAYCGLIPGHERCAGCLQPDKLERMMVILPPRWSKDLR